MTAATIQTATGAVPGPVDGYGIPTVAAPAGAPTELTTAGAPVIPAQRSGHPEMMAAVERAQAGDREAFGRLYQQYRDVVFRFVYYRCRDRQLAEDLTADTFYKALRRIDSFTDQGRDVGAWFITIARNLLYDHHKSGRYRLEIAGGELVGFDHADSTPEGRPEQTVVDDLTHHAQLADVMAALPRLTPEQGRCIVLRFLRGLSLEETGRVMGLNVGAVKALQYRATRSLAQLVST